MIPLDSTKSLLWRIEVRKKKQKKLTFFYVIIWWLFSIIHPPPDYLLFSKIWKPYEIVLKKDWHTGKGGVTINMNTERERVNVDTSATRDRNKEKYIKKKINNTAAGDFPIDAVFTRGHTKHTFSLHTRSERKRHLLLVVVVIDRIHTIMDCVLALYLGFCFSIEK